MSLSGRNCTNSRRLQGKGDRILQRPWLVSNKECCWRFDKLGTNRGQLVDKLTQEEVEAKYAEFSNREWVSDPSSHYFYQYSCIVKI